MICLVKPSISVLLLSYNHEKYIERAVKSVFEQAKYGFDMELIIIDDGSTDRTPFILRKLESESPITMRVFFNQHEGVTSISKNFQKLITLSSKKYLSFLASDDEFMPDRFADQVEILERNPNLKLVYSNGVNVKDGYQVGFVHDEEIVEKLSNGSAQDVYAYVTSKTPLLYIQGILVRSDFIKEFEPFDTSLIADDWVFNIRVFKYLSDIKSDFSYFDKVVFKRNILEKSTSNNPNQHFNRVAQVALKYIDSRNYSFYLKFYIVFIISFAKNKDLKSCFKLIFRLFLLNIPLMSHNKNVDKIIDLNG